MNPTTGESESSDGMQKIPSKNQIAFSLRILIASAVILAVAYKAPGLDPVRSWLCFFAGALPLLVFLLAKKKFPAVPKTVALAVVFCLIAIELGARVTPVSEKVRKRFFGQDFLPNPYCFWTPQSLAVFNTADGRMRKIQLETTGEIRTDDPNAPRREGFKRLLLLGGSNAAGARIRLPEDTMIARLRDELRRGRPEENWELISAGVHGYVLYQNVVFYKLYLRALKPDVVILYANNLDAQINLEPESFRNSFLKRTGVDLSDLWITEQQFPKTAETVEEVRGKLRDVKTLRFMSDWVKDRRKGRASGANVDSNPLNEYTQNLKDLVAIVQQDGARLILADEFDNYQYIPSSFALPALIARRHEISRIMEETAAAENVPFIPAHAILHERFRPEEIMLKIDPYHLNEKGHEETARLFFEKMQAVIPSQKSP